MKQDVILAANTHPPTTWRVWLRVLLRDLFGTVLPAVIIAALIHVFLAQANEVRGPSMEPSLYTDQRLVIEKITYHFHGPRRGDIVVLRDPAGGAEPLIKRVIGLPGERITIADGQVFIDGVPLTEAYAQGATYSGHNNTWMVKPFHVFVMGDNRSASRDSRMFDSVPIDQIIGHAVFRYWPWQQVGPM